MEKIFTLHELEVLDDLMPESIKKKKHLAAEADDGDDESNGTDELDEDKVSCRSFIYRTQA